ncbi:MAG TPA: hypothetical protein PKA53_08450, partial [Sphingobacterium sp.]|nr:hypothetical protein [Sphingobacterium sp.]
MKINLLVILFALIMTSCKVTEEKARSWVYANKDVLAMWCDDCFFDKKEFVYVEGKTVTLTDTVLDS